METAIANANVLSTEFPKESGYALQLSQTVKAREAVIETQTRGHQSCQERARHLAGRLDQDHEPFITSAARLRLAAFSADDPREKVEQYNTMLKQSVWLISEYAGGNAPTLLQQSAQKTPLSLPHWKTSTLIAALSILPWPTSPPSKRCRKPTQGICRHRRNGKKFVSEFNDTRNQVFAADNPVSTHCPQENGSARRPMPSFNSGSFCCSR